MTLAKRSGHNNAYFPKKMDSIEWYVQMLYHRAMGHGIGAHQKRRRCRAYGALQVCRPRQHTSGTQCACLHACADPQTLRQPAPRADKSKILTEHNKGKRSASRVARLIITSHHWQVKIRSYCRLCSETGSPAQWLMHRPDDLFPD